ncbi:helix-turn-helix domain-containing protein [Litchfieldia alkalitelluris]|uniref:helix-turn-helix domain-containing protein n=1 Tax=Litchfieldia alkalitelluris TaxID=304268 RepID=UPI001475B115|nr:helix-turn-helix transcriptional regulator [Litchfieldia alkalitelluris]
MNTGKVLGERIRRFRKKKKWSQADLAEKVGVSNTFMGNIERGEKPFSLETLEKIATVLGITLYELLIHAEDLGKAQQSEVLTEIIDKLAYRPALEQKSALKMIDHLLDTIDSVKKSKN